MAYVIQIEIDAELAKKGSKEAVKSIRSVGESSKKADKHVSKMEKSMERAGKAMKVMAVAATALAVAMAVKLAKSIITIGAEFEQLRAQLKTVEGSVGAAESAFQRIQDFAKSTPFEVAKITEAWINLRGLGLEPTMEQFNSLGNLAAARGKDITEASMAVSGAIFGETERLKAFGIAASISGDEITLSYKGMATTVQRTSADVLAAISKISDDNFATAMRDQSRTVAGAWSNVKDAYAAFADFVFTSGVGDFLTDLLRNLARQISDLPENIRSFRVDWAVLMRDAKLATIDFAWGSIRAVNNLIKILGMIGDTFQIKPIEGSKLDEFAKTIQGMDDAFADMAKEVKVFSDLEVAKILEESADAAEDLAENLVAATGGASGLREKIAKQIKINAALILDVELGKGMQENIDDTLEASLMRSIEEAELADAMEEVLRKAVSNTHFEDGILFPNQGPPGTTTDAGGGGNSGEIVDSAASGVVQLTQAIDSMGDSTKQLIGIFANMISAMASTKITASDWITLIVQVGLAIIAHGKKAEQARAENWKGFLEASLSIQDLTNKHKAGQTRLNNELDAVLAKLSKVGDMRAQAARRAFEDEMAFLKLRQGQEANQGILGLMENLALYVKDEQLAAEIRKTTIALEVASLQVQFKTLQQMGAFANKLGVIVNDVNNALTGGGGPVNLQQQPQGTNAQPYTNTLDFLGPRGGSNRRGNPIKDVLDVLNDKIPEAAGKAGESLEEMIERIIGVATEGLESGLFEVGGGGGSGVGKQRRQQLVAMFEEAARMAGIMEDQVGSMLGHFHEMRVLASKIKMSEEQRAATAAEIAMREAQAADQLGLSLLDRVAQATDNEAMLVELEAARFEVERAHTIEQIDLLIASGKLTDDMAERLAKARDDFADFDFEALSKAATDWDSLMDALRGFGEQASNAERLRDAFDQSMQFLVDSGLPDAQLMEKAGEAWRLAHEAAESIALTMIDTLAKAVGSEEDIAKVAKLRHFLEVASFRAQAELLKPLLDPETFAWLTRLIDDFSMMDPNSGSRSGGGNNRVVRAIEDQTDSLLDGWRRLMGDLLAGSDSPLSPKQQKDFFQSEYNRLFALARSGDTVAEAELQNLIPQFRDAMAVFTGGTQTSAFNDFFGGLMRDISLLSGLENPLPGLGFTGGSSTASTDNIIGSFQAFEVQADQASAQAHQDSRELRQEIRNLNDKIDLLAAKQSAAGSG